MPVIEGLSKEFISKQQQDQYIGRMPIIYHYETQRQEMIGITQKIEQILTDGIDPGKIGIIYKENNMVKNWRNISSWKICIMKT